VARRISIRRIILAVVAVALITQAITFASAYWRIERNFTESMVARPVSLSVDLSQPAQYTARFQQTCSSAHGEAICLAIDPANAKDGALEKLLEGLDGRITISDCAGTEVRKVGIDAESRAKSQDCRRPAVGPGEIEIAYFHPFPISEYSATITVTKGAPGLRGAKQTVFAKYELCGMERMPALIAAILGWACGVPGIVLAVIAAVRFYKHGIWRRTSNAP
jgi:hypothetical protein